MINIKIKGTEYTLEEAREIYNELRQIFEEPETHITGSDAIPEFEPWKEKFGTWTDIFGKTKEFII